MELIKTLKEYARNIAGLMYLSYLYWTLMFMDMVRMVKEGSDYLVEPFYDLYNRAVYINSQNDYFEDIEEELKKHRDKEEERL